MVGTSAIVFISVLALLKMLFAPSFKELLLDQIKTKMNTPKRISAIVTIVFFTLYTPFAIK
jgi:hypothetical protein